MNEQERNALIDKIIVSQHKGKGMRPDYLVYNDRANWLKKQTDEFLIKELNPKLEAELN